MENNNIPKSMVINLDQTPSKYLPGCNKTLALKRIKSASVAGSTDKGTITATFNITMDGKFLPMQIIYGGKTSKSIPPVSFPDSFLVSGNKKHCRNEKESLKMLEHIIIPYVKSNVKISVSILSTLPYWLWMCLKVRWRNKLRICWIKNNISSKKFQRI